MASSSSGVVNDAIDAFLNPTRRTVTLKHPADDSSGRGQKQVKEKEDRTYGVPAYRVKKGKAYVKNYVDQSPCASVGKDEYLETIYSTKTGCAEEESTDDCSSDDDSFGEDECSEDGGHAGPLDQSNGKEGGSTASRDYCASLASFGGLTISDGTSESSLASKEELFERIVKLYKSQDFVKIPQVKSLTIHQCRSEIISVVDNHRASIVQGNPGCGKSTQVPQMILSEAARAGKPCRIVVTQPRRIAAKTLAKFICAQRKWRLGDYVGYQVGLDKGNQCEYTLILFATPGVVLRKLQGPSAGEFLNSVTHFILDEVHERNKDLDFLMMLLKSHMLSGKAFKLVMMSATMEAKIFQDYFWKVCTRESGSTANIPVVKIPHVSFHVGESWLEDLTSLAHLPELKLEQPMFDPVVAGAARILIREIEKLEGFADGRSGSQSGQRNAILVFLPGISEIQEMHEELSGSAFDFGWEIVLLHSRLMSSQEELAFDDVRSGHRKIILATNIAESSLTFPDVQYVIDFGLTRRDFCDHGTSLSYLRLEWVSKSELCQRRGRAGRVRNGHVFHLIPRALVKKLPEYAPPEMERTPLPNLVAMAKTFRFNGGVKEVFASCICPPNEEDVERGIVALKELGGLTLDRHGQLDAFDGDLTLLGEMINVLPVDVHLSRLILIGFCFGIIDDCIALAAILSNTDLFQHSFQKECKIHYTKLYWSRGTESDCIAFLEAYKNWKSVPESSRKRFCAENFLDRKLLKEVELRENDLRDILRRAAFILPRDFSPTIPPAEAYVLLKVALAGAFYPNYLLPEAKSEDGAFLDLMDHDPSFSVVIRSLPENAELYADQIARICSDISTNVRLGFHGSKCVVEFVPTGIEDHSQPGLEDLINSRQRQTYREFNGVHAGVNLSIRKRKACRKGISIRAFETLPVLPNLKPAEDDVIKPPDTCFGVEPVAVDVTHVSPTGRLWIRVKKERNARGSMYDEIAGVLNTPGFVDTLEPVERAAIKCGMFVVGPSEKMAAGEKYQRGKLVHFESGKPNCVILFVDQGFSESVPVSFLKQFRAGLLGGVGSHPAQAVPCELSGISPHPYSARDGAFSPEAIEKIIQFVGNGLEGELKVRFFSAAHGHLRIHVERHTSSGAVELLNHRLCTQGLAVVCEESWLSTRNHEEWLMRIDRSSVPGKASLISAKLVDENPKELSYWLERGAAVEAAGSRLKTVPYAIRGPTSPFEVHFTPLTLGLKSRKARVHLDSLNSAAVDIGSSIGHSKLLVAEKLKLDSHGQNVLGYHTTLMYLSPGQLTLLCMIFAPYVEFRRRWHEGKVDGLLCGLGFTKDAEGRVTAMYPDHDLEISNDVEIFESDIHEANAIRKTIHELLQGAKNQGALPRTYQRILSLQTNLRTRIQDFLCLQRLPRRTDGRVFPGDSPFRCNIVGQWGHFGDGEVRNFMLNAERNGGRALLALSVPKLSVEEEEDRYHFLAEELTRLARVKIQLGKTERSLVFLVDSKCGLCGIKHLTLPQTWRTHLNTEDHKLKQKAAVAEAHAMGMNVKQLFLCGRPFPATQHVRTFQNRFDRIEYEVTRNGPQGFKGVRLTHRAQNAAAVPVVSSDSSSSNHSASLDSGRGEVPASAELPVRGRGRGRGFIKIETTQFLG